MLVQAEYSGLELAYGLERGFQAEGYARLSRGVPR